MIDQPRAVLMPDVATRGAEEARFNFLNHQLDHYGAFELQTLEKVLQANPAIYTRAMRARHEKTMRDIAERIRARIEFTDPVPAAEVPRFLSDFYRAQRRYLETRQLFGDAREDKFHDREETTT